MTFQILKLATVAAVGLVLIASVFAADEQPQHTLVQVEVDPCVELFSIIFRLAGSNEYSQGRVESYTKDVESHFGPFRNHSVVEMAKKLRATRGVSYDAPMSLAVLLVDAEKLETKVPLEPWPESLDRRWTAQNVREFLEAARQFVHDTSYVDFFKKHRPLYEIAESRMQAVLEKEGHLEWFHDFFGERPSARFTVVLGMLNGGCCYGPHCRTADGKEELYCVLGVWKTDAEGKPQFTTDVISTVIHEFCHSYTNGFILRHEAELKTAGEKLYAPVASAMQSQAYGGGKTVLCESMVRACVVRYMRKYAGEEAAKKEVKRNIDRKFACVGYLSDLLGEYESQRDQYPTIEAFSPRLVSFFVEYADKFAKEQQALDAGRPKIISLVPANGDHNVDPDLKAIQVVFDRPMKDKCWSLVGGGPHFPEFPGKCAYDSICTTWTCPIKLKPDWDYKFRLNAQPKFMAFQSQEGVPLKPVVVSFRTAKKVGMETAEAMPTRTWSDVTGAFSVEAQFVKFDDGKVKLKKGDGKTVAVPLERLCAEDRDFVAQQIIAKRAAAKADAQPQELSHDNGKMASKSSIAGGGHVVKFKADGDSNYVASVSLHGFRYGAARPPKEKFNIWICDAHFKPIATFRFPYGSYTRGNPAWKNFRIRPTRVPEEFIVCFGFNPQRTQGIYVSHDGNPSETSMVGVPGEREPKPFSKGNWMIRCKVEKRQDGGK